jgi:hypothetical protein
VSLEGAARIIGKAPSTLYKWYREGKFPPAVDLSQFSRHPSQPSVIVPLDRLDALRNGERMRPVLQSDQPTDRAQDTLRIMLDPAGHPFCLCAEE